MAAPNTDTAPTAQVSTSPGLTSMTTTSPARTASASSASAIESTSTSEPPPPHSRSRGGPSSDHTSARASTRRTTSTRSRVSGDTTDDGTINSAGFVPIPTGPGSSTISGPRSTDTNASSSSSSSGGSSPATTAILATLAIVILILAALLVAFYINYKKRTIGSRDHEMASDNDLGLSNGSDDGLKGPGNAAEVETHHHYPEPLLTVRRFSNRIFERASGFWRHGGAVVNNSSSEQNSGNVESTGMTGLNPGEAVVSLAAKRISGPEKKNSKRSKTTFTPSMFVDFYKSSSPPSSLERPGKSSDEKHASATISISTTSEDPDIGIEDEAERERRRKERINKYVSLYTEGTYTLGRDGKRVWDADADTEIVQLGAVAEDAETVIIDT